MIRYLLIGALIYLAGLLLRRFIRALGQAHTANENTAGDTSVISARCAHCGLFIPKSQAIQAGNDYFCSEEHRRAGRKPIE